MRNTKSQVIVAKSATETDIIELNEVSALHTKEVSAMFSNEAIVRDGYETLCLAMMAGKVDGALIDAAKAVTEKGSRDNKPLAALVGGDEEGAKALLNNNTSFKALRHCLEAAPATLRNAWGEYCANKKVIRRGALGMQSLHAALVAFGAEKKARTSLTDALKTWAKANGDKAESVLPETVFDILVEYKIIATE